MSEHVDVKEAKEKYEEILDDETEAQLAFSRQMYRFDMSCSRREGYEDGVEEGRKVGKKEQQKEFAKKMIAKGINIEEIIEITELTKEEIEKLK